MSDYSVFFHSITKSSDHLTHRPTILMNLLVLFFANRFSFLLPIDGQKKNDENNIILVFSVSKSWFCLTNTQRYSVHVREAAKEECLAFCLKINHRNNPP